MAEYLCAIERYCYGYIAYSRRTIVSNAHYQGQACALAGIARRRENTLHTGQRRCNGNEVVLCFATRIIARWTDGIYIVGFYCYDTNAHQLPLYYTARKQYRGIVECGRTRRQYRRSRRSQQFACIFKIAIAIPIGVNAYMLVGIGIASTQIHLQGYCLAGTESGRRCIQFGKISIGSTLGSSTVINRTKAEAVYACAAIFERTRSTHGCTTDTAYNNGIFLGSSQCTFMIYDNSISTSRYGIGNQDLLHIIAGIIATGSRLGSQIGTIGSRIQLIGHYPRKKSYRSACGIVYYTYIKVIDQYRRKVV
ncbi:MAG: hypothetical protein DDT38_01318 [Firmicutes bacterium]|nr:hypothetical protein [candidate division NPL-UPA2 bacterium]